MYAAILFIGITNGQSVQPVLSVERFVSYRERAAGMYSALPFAFAQVFSSEYTSFCSFIICKICQSECWWTCCIFHYAGCYWVSLCICPVSYILLNILFHGFLWMDCCKVHLVHILHVLHNAVFYILWNDDHGRHTKSSSCCHHCCTILYALEPFQWFHDPS